MRSCMTVTSILVTFYYQSIDASVIYLLSLVDTFQHPSDIFKRWSNVRQLRPAVLHHRQQSGMYAYVGLVEVVDWAINGCFSRAYSLNDNWKYNKRVPIRRNHIAYYIKLYAIIIPIAYSFRCNVSLDTSNVGCYEHCRKAHSPKLIV